MKIVNSHPTLNWLSGISYGHRVPSRVSSQLARVKTTEMARAFVRSSGLEVAIDEKRESRTAVAVSVIMSGEQQEYYRPEICLPRIDCAELPLGSALMNCLLPPIEGRAQAEAVFADYQKMVWFLARRMEARPFACITGYKNGGPAHDLFERGFRFFFSPSPEISFAKLLHILQIKTEFKTPGLSIEVKRGLASKILNAEFVMTTEGRMGHSLLEDVVLMQKDTELVRLFPEG